MRTVLTIVGPESSGTRLWEKVMSLHPQVYGVTDRGEDPFEDVWCATSVGDRQLSFPRHSKPYAVTRRSLPHGMPGKTSAKFMKFVNLYAYHESCLSHNYMPIYLVTTRAVAPHLESWRRERSSSKQTGRKTCCVMEQYRTAYEMIFEFTSSVCATWWIVSLEPLVYQVDYIHSVYKLLGLDPYNLYLEFKNPNNRRYDQFKDLDLADRDIYREPELVRPEST